MNIKRLALVLMVVVMAGLSACDEETETKTETVEKSVVNGTVVEDTTKIETTIGEDGNKVEETKKETTVDPAGLMNKTTTEEKTRTEETH